MSFTASFSITSQIVPGSFVLNDTSSGSDSNLTGRRIYLYQANGELLTGAYINFPLSAGSSITLDVLSVDYCLLIVVEWVSSSPLPSPSTYSASGLYLFRGYSLQFLDQQIGAIQSNPSILQDTNFYDSLGRLQTDIDCAIQAASTGQQSSAQAALSRIQYLITNQSKFF